MAEERVQRRLAAILAADMVGYSRLMGADEEGTIVRQKAHRVEMIDPGIAAHNGRIVKTMGDGLLVEFASVVDAVKYAVAVQQAMSVREADVPEDRRIQYRVGINLGDIVIDGEDILGDGVNIAARLEGEAEPGGICISGDAFRQVQGKLDYAFEDLGERVLKNIAEPVRAYRIRLQDDPVASVIGSDVSPVSPEMPSIAVLPFDNLSNDLDQEYFADGITEDIITDLSRFPDLIVIARNSSFTYKGRAVKVQDVGRELGVTHVLEGSVRKTSNRVRITAQLIDASNGSHIWAERYDREIVDIFDLQDEITQAIVAVLPGRVAETAVGRLDRKRPSDMVAYDFVLAGKIHHHRFTKDDNIEALRLLGKAIDLEPNYATAWAWQACTLGQALDLHYRDDPDEVYRLAIESIDKALALNENDVECHRLLCEVNMEDHKLDQAQVHHDKAFSLNPRDVRLVAQHGELLTWAGKPDEGAAWIEKAMQLDPFATHSRAHLLGRALHAARHYPEALDAFKQIPSPRYTLMADMAACSAQMGDEKASEDKAAEVLRLKPDFSASGYVSELPYKESGDRAHHLEGLIKAGLPE